MKKNPWIAAILNAILPGLGYLYLQKKKLFGAFLLLSMLSGIVWVATDPILSETISDFSNMWGNIATLAFAISFGMDAYHEAKQT